jgi:Mn2+/Fe2+ NRAMP family transporter
MRGGHRRPLKDLRRGGEQEIRRMRIDTVTGMIYSNLIAYFIVLTTAATLNSQGITDIQSASQAAEALRPIAGEFAFVLFALGIVGTGLLAVPVLAGSAAYGVAETFGWHATLEAKAPEAVGFYSIIGAATLIGLALGYAPINPIQFLVWSAVLNGIIAVPIMAAMMVVVTSSAQMGRFRASRNLALCGWAATGLMALTVAAMFWSLLA